MKKRGKGVGSMWYGIGNTGLPNPAAAFVEVLGDGTANLMFGAADIGQGSGTTMAQIAAEVLGMSYEKIRVTWGDTRVTPDGGTAVNVAQAPAEGDQTVEGGAPVNGARAEAERDYTAEGATLQGSPQATSVTFNGKTCKR